MIGLIQRVSESRVIVDTKIIGEIGRGILVLVGVEKNDAEQNADRLAERLLAYRVFPDNDDKMNCSVRDINGGVLLVPQFTLAADTQKGTRAGFSTAAEPARAQQLFDYLVARVKQNYRNVQIGKFGADMKVSLVNDGPVTFWLQTK